MSYINDYKKQKEDVLEILHRTGDFFSRIGDDARSSAVSELIHHTEHDVFAIVVVGQFSAGKSTFLNALMGEKYLPSFAAETTATINFLKSVNDSPTGKPLVVVHYNDGQDVTDEDVTLESIEKYVSTRGEGVAQKVSSVDLYLDSPYLNDGVTLVDSPGLNGVLEGHAELTRDQINKSHASIFMFNATQPGSKSDFEILKNLKDHCDRILIVLNHIDNINKSEQSIDSVIADLKKNYQQFFPNDTLPEILPIAAYPALVARSKAKLDYRNRFVPEEDKPSLLETSLIEKFEERLMRYLTKGEKTREQLLAPVRKAEIFLSEAKKECEQQIASLSDTADSAQIIEEINLLEEEVRKLSVDIKERENTLRKGISETIERAEYEIKNNTRNIRESYLRKISDIVDVEDLEHDAQSYINRMNLEYTTVYEEAISVLDRDFKEIVRDNFSQLSENVEDRLNASMVRNHELDKKTITLDADKLSIDLDLDDIFAQKQAFMQQLSELEAQIDATDLDVANSQKLERKKAELEQQIQMVGENFKANVMGLGGRPSPQTRTCYREVRTGGILGKIKSLWNGNPAKSIPYETTDDSAGRDYDKLKNDLQVEHNNKVKELQAKIDSIPDTDSAVYQMNVRKLEREKARLKENLQELEEQSKKVRERELKKQTRKAKAYIEQCLDTIDTEVRDTVVKNISSMKEEMLQLAKDVIECNISEAIKNKRMLLESKKQTLSSSVEDKQAKLAETNQRLSEIKDLLPCVLDLNDELSNMVIDEIKNS